MRRLFWFCLTLLGSGSAGTFTQLLVFPGQLLRQFDDLLVGEAFALELPVEALGHDLVAVLVQHVGGGSHSVTRCVCRGGSHGGTKPYAQGVPGLL